MLNNETNENSTAAPSSCNNNPESFEKLGFTIKHNESGGLHKSLFKSGDNSGSRSRKASFCITKDKANNGAGHHQLGFDNSKIPKLRNKFASPTDRLLSPCSKKLSDHKAKIFGSKSKPVKLSFSEASNEDSDDSL